MSGVEQSLLGALLLGAPFTPVAELLDAGHFTRPDHALIFAAIASLAHSGTAVDATTVADHLARFEQLTDAGGLAYLSSLARETPNSENAVTYARVVRVRADRRLTVGAVTDALADAGGLSAQHILADLGERVTAVKESLLADRSSRPALDWKALESQPLPERQWIIDHWLPAGHNTLLAGLGGLGKSMVSQAMASCIAVRREYIDWPSAERRVLMWACEDDAGELHRRQAAIAKWLGLTLSDFADRLVLLSYDREDVELAGLCDLRLVESPKLRQLREQIGDYQSDVVFLDPIARLYGGNENDRHQVAQFMAMLARAGDATKAAIVLVGHPGKGQSSEYSGSTAWEGAVRARLFLGRTLPDASEEHDDEPTQDDGVRYLSRRKANYSARDWRRLEFRDGVMTPVAAPLARNGNGHTVVDSGYASDVVTRAVAKLASMGHFGVSARHSPNFLPKLAKTYGLLETILERDFAQAMRQLEKDGKLVKGVVGTYANRAKREGLTLAQ